MKLYILPLFFVSFLVSCKKIIEIPPPVDTITSSQVFTTEEQAASASANMYFQLINSNTSFASYSSTLYCGMSADELRIFNQTTTAAVQFETNSIDQSNNIIYNNFWTKAYSVIYLANALIEGLEENPYLTDSVKQELIGEAKFIRAFCNFYLVNLFGNIPLVRTTEWQSTALLTRSTVEDVYQAIISDLKDAQNLLASDFSVGKGQRIIPNKWVATALLARTYLYMGEWSKAENEATIVINNTSLFSLSMLDNVFLKNSNEAIWQLEISNVLSPWATREGNAIIPINNTRNPNYYLTNHLLTSFELGDQRRSKWVDSTTWQAVKYFYPKKYKIRQGAAGQNVSEFYMVFRLAELYLIRAESRVRQSKLTEAVSDLNVVRQRAGLPLLVSSLTQQQIIDAVEKENRIEFFAEWGHRWLDLKRWAKADAVLGPVKGANWQATDQLYPIPLRELTTNPNLTQNPGY